MLLILARKLPNDRVFEIVFKVVPFEEMKIWMGFLVNCKKNLEMKNIKSSGYQQIGLGQGCILVQRIIFLCPPPSPIIFSSRSHRAKPDNILILKALFEHFCYWF
jgi:hypothetical protein